MMIPKFIDFTFILGGAKVIAMTIATYDTTFSFSIVPLLRHPVLKLKSFRYILNIYKHPCFQHITSPWKLRHYELGSPGIVNLYINYQVLPDLPISTLSNCLLIRRRKCILTERTLNCHTYEYFPQTAQKKHFQSI